MITVDNAGVVKVGQGVCRGWLSLASRSLDIDEVHRGHKGTAFRGTPGSTARRRVGDAHYRPGRGGYRQ